NIEVAANQEVLRVGTAAVIGASARPESAHEVGGALNIGAGAGAGRAEGREGVGPKAIVEIGSVEVIDGVVRRGAVEVVSRPISNGVRARYRDRHVIAVGQLPVGGGEAELVGAVVAEGDRRIGGGGI